MNNIQQAISNPLGVTVFGSAVMRVEPDVVALQFAVVQFKSTPREAFDATRADARKVQSYLQQAGINDVKSSRIHLHERTSHGYSGPRPEGYEAELTYSVLLGDVNRMEEILVGVVEAGANRINRAGFETTQRKRIRQEARQQAIFAAREKAELYCNAAGTELGQVLHIEDLNPLRMGEEYMGHGGVRQAAPDYDDAPSALNPGSIEVYATVMVSYAIKS